MSTRAVVNSAWESGANSSRESAQQGARIGQHLNRLHKKAQDQETTGQARSQSVMSNMTHPSSSFNSSTGGGARRASDPGRVLDRNFGVNGQISRHRSGSYAGQQENSGYQVIFTLLST